MPIVSGGGGGGLPLTGGTVSGPVAVHTTDLNAVALAVQVADGMNENAVEVSTATGPPAGVYVDDNSATVQVGEAGTGSAALNATGTDGALNLSNSTGARSIGLGTSAAGNLIEASLAGTVMRVGPNGQFGIHNNSLPADADVSISEAVIWFDSTNGAGNTKLMVKGKSADGTVKTAAILLA